MKLAYRLLLIVGHTLGDFALPLMKRQCARVGASLETLSPAQADRMLPVLERVLEAYLARPADLKAIMHEMRLEVGAERFASGELAPARVDPADPPLQPRPAKRIAQGAPPGESPKAPRRKGPGRP